jgi:hypothetical protein
MLAFIAPDRFGGLQGTELVQAEPTHPIDVHRRTAGGFSPLQTSH